MIISIVFLDMLINVGMVVVGMILLWIVGGLVCSEVCLIILSVLLIRWCCDFVVIVVCLVVVVFLVRWLFLVILCV